MKWIKKFENIEEEVHSTQSKLKDICSISTSILTHLNEDTDPPQWVLETDSDHLFAFKEMVEDMGYSYSEQLEYIPQDPTDGDTVPDAINQSVTHKCTFVSIDLGSSYQNISKLNNILKLVTELIHQKKRLEPFGVEEIRYQFLESSLNINFIHKFSDDEIFMATVDDLREDTDDISTYCNGVSRVGNIKVDKDNFTITLTLNVDDKEDYKNYVENYLSHFECDKKDAYEGGSTRRGSGKTVYTYVVKLIKPRSATLPNYND